MQPKVTLKILCMKILKLKKVKHSTGIKNALLLNVIGRNSDRGAIILHTKFYRYIFKLHA